ncbi:MAG: ROK family transcriptional regulator [Hamadaea sp.]|nr:ROK family transcriptional regulator [Hamadaea sp.]NUR51349.1 ROK family transcriptional regulator [Hamadaea sp.]NUT06913.1 ROK family transcriptional regulator [Hamadaea sp.]
MTQTAPAKVGDATTANVFMTVLTRGPIARSEIAHRLGLSAGTITRSAKPLIEAGYLVEDAAGDVTRPGRPTVPLKVVPEREFVIGIKLAGDHCVGVVVDLLANVRATREVAISTTSVDAVVTAVAGLVGQLRLAVDGPITRLGLGLGGHVDTRVGTVRYAPFLDWRDVPLAKILSGATGLPVVIENDVNALTVAEQWFGAGLDVPSFAVVTIGAGVGCGLVVNGALVHGAVGLAGELGHVPLDPAGPMCRCGNTGCVEARSADTAILRQVAADTGRQDLDILAAAELARHGDAAAVAAFEAAGNWLGRALATVANLVNPDRIILSGEGLAASDLFESAARQSFYTHAYGQAADCDLLIRPLPEHTWARGAAAVAIQHLFLTAPTR